MKKRVLTFFLAFSMCMGMAPISGSTVYAGTSYTVKRGDCLWSIAKAVYGDGKHYTDILKANRDRINDPNLIYEGLGLVIPDIPGIKAEPGNDPASKEGDEAGAVSKQVEIQGTNFGDNIKTAATFDPAWITTYDNSKYNEDLASFCILATADTYYREKDKEKGSVNRVLISGTKDEDYTITSFMEGMGFTDVEFVETFRKKTYTENPNDSATFIMAYKNVDNKYDAYAFVFRGVYSVGEWISYFGPGENGAHHEGIDRSMGRAEEFISDYMAKHDSSDRADCVLITGHSRGGAIANLLGAAFEDEGEVRPYTYTISSPATVYKKNKKSYRTIFNLANSNDLVLSMLPFKNEEPEVYGTKIYTDISASSLPGYNGLSASEIEEYKSVFEARFDSRSTLNDARSIKEQFDTLEAADSRAKELKSLTGDDGLRISPFVSIKDAKKLATGKYEVEFSYSDQAVLYGYGMIMAYGQKSAEAFENVFKEDEAGCKPAEFMAKNAQKITVGHKASYLY